VATAVFLVLAVLVPRPLMLPLTVWLLWKRPATRLPFLAFFVAHAVIVVWLGYAQDWFAALTDVNAELVNAYNFGPSRFIGAWWIPIGLALAAWLTWRGNLGFASLAISPYWLPYYFLMLVLEVARPTSTTTGTGESSESAIGAGTGSAPTTGTVTGSTAGSG
jgi:hypothetical protein